MNLEIYEQEIKDWDSNASYYEKENFMPYNQILKEELESFYQIKKSEKVLDVGGGASKIPENVVLVDFSPEMVKLAQKINPLNKVILTSVHQMPLINETFDVIKANGLLHHLKIQGIFKESIKEFYRVLKKDGRLCIFDRAPNFIPNLFYISRKPFKFFLRFFGIRSKCGTSHETFFLNKDIEKILSYGFTLEKRKYIVNIFFQFLYIFSDLLQYLFGFKKAYKFQLGTWKLAKFFEKNFNFKILCAEQCLVLKKN